MENAEFIENRYIIKLNNTIICAETDFNEAKNFYDRQVQNWKEHYKDKVIENNDTLYLVDYYEDRIINQCSKLDLL